MIGERPLAIHLGVSGTQRSSVSDELETHVYKHHHPKKEIKTTEIKITHG